MYVDPSDFTPEGLAKIKPTCGECGSKAHVILAQGQAIYPTRRDLWSHEDGEPRYWWLCPGCRAYCGVHRGTITPLGTPAGPETRKAREAAHAAFDPLWMKRQRLDKCSKSVARNKGYKWLAARMGVDRKDCHIGAMTTDQARRVVEICKERRNANQEG